MAWSTSAQVITSFTPFMLPVGKLANPYGATPPETLSPSSPTVAGGIVYVGSEDGKLYIFDATCRQACRSLWSYTTGDTIQSSPAIAGGIVYIVSMDRKLYAF